MDNQKIYTEPLEQEEGGSRIDFKALFDAMKKHKSLYWKVLPISFVLACIIVLSLPNKYTCEVLLAPELSTRRSTASISALAQQVGLKMGSGTLGNTEALYPTLYPDLINSSDFKVSLFNVPVHKKDSVRIMTYYDYLKNEQKSPWWNQAISPVISFFSSLFEEEAEEKDSFTSSGGEKPIDPFQLTKAQTNIVKSLEKSIVCEVDEKTLEISITVTDQDPLICATMADSVQARLQDFITEYRTKKAKVDLVFNQNLYAEAKERYNKARLEYAAYADANQDVVWATDRIKLMDLENEMQLQYESYRTITQQLRAAEAKVQEDTPSFTTLQSATVPVKKSGPKRTKIVLVIVFLAFLGTSAWVLYKEDQLKPLLGLS